MYSTLKSGRSALALNFLLLLLLMVSLMALAGCSDDDNPAAPVPETFTRPADAAFAVRNGTQLNPIGTPGIFDADQDQAMLEFPLDFAVSPSVVITVEILDFIFSSGAPPGAFNVSFYEGDGLAGVADYDAGIALDTLAIASGERKTFNIDVTAQVAALRSGGATHIGLRFSNSSLGQLSIQADPVLTAGP